MNNLGKSSKITVVSNTVAAGITAVDPSAVDMSGFESVMFIVQFGAITATGTAVVKARHSTDNGSGDAFADILGSGQNVADTQGSKVFVLDVVKPSKRYVKPYIARATANSVIESITAIQYNPSKAPVTQGSTVAGISTIVSNGSGAA